MVVASAWTVTVGAVRSMVTRKGSDHGEATPLSVPIAVKA
jgi:hypothetical protein